MGRPRSEIGGTKERGIERWKIMVVDSWGESYACVGEKAVLKDFIKFKMLSGGGLF